MDRLLTTKELAELFGLNPQTLRVWRANGDGPPYVKFGDDQRGRCRYDAAKVEAWLAERTRDQP